MLSLAVNILDQGNQIGLEFDVIMRTAKSPLSAELAKRDSAVRAGAIVDAGNFRMFAFFELIELNVEVRSRNFLSLTEVILGAGLTKMNFRSFPLPKLRDVERGGFRTPTTFLHAKGLTRFNR